jgi:hypothetical protein
VIILGRLINTSGKNSMQKYTTDAKIIAKIATKTATKIAAKNLLY